MGNALFFILAALAGCPGNHIDTDSGGGKDLDSGDTGAETVFVPLNVYTWDVTGDDEVPENGLVTILDSRGQPTVGNSNPEQGDEPTATIELGQTYWVHPGSLAETDSENNPLHVDSDGQKWTSVGSSIKATTAEVVEADYWFNFYTHMVGTCEFDRYDYRGDYFDTIDCGSPEVEVIEDQLVNYDDATFNGGIGNDEELEVYGNGVNLLTDFEAEVTDSDMSVDPSTLKTIIRVRIEMSDGTAKELTIIGSEIE